MKWSPGQKVKLGLEEARRSYTPSLVEPDAQLMDIVFFLHGNGLFSRWAASVDVGDVVGVIGPVNSMPEKRTLPQWAFFMGDETTIGLAQALLNDLSDDISISGAIEVDMVDHMSVSAARLPLQSAIRNGEHGVALRRWLSRSELPEGPGIVWLSGDAGTVRDLKRDLLRMGLERSQIRLKPYWSVKGHGHRKVIQKEL